VDQLGIYPVISMGMELARTTTPGKKASPVEMFRATRRSARRVAAGIITLALAASPSASWGEALDPAASVAKFHGALLGVMQSGADFAGRVDVLEPAVAEFFDVQTIARISLGRTWRALDAQSQAEFSELLDRLIVATYASRFETFNGQSFHTLDSQASNRGWLVKTELERASGKPVTLDYYFRDAGVFNVVADGVSDLSLRRADYNSIVKSDGFAVLLAHLRRNISDYGVVLDSGGERIDD
jgi:phospholipid transport system substrate-binding protein